MRELLRVSQASNTFIVIVFHHLSSCHPQGNWGLTHSSTFIDEVRSQGDEFQGAPFKGVVAHVEPVWCGSRKIGSETLAPTFEQVELTPTPRKDIDNYG